MCLCISVSQTFYAFIELKKIQNMPKTQYISFKHAICLVFSSVVSQSWYSLFWMSGHTHTHTHTHTDRSKMKLLEAFRRLNIHCIY